MPIEFKRMKREEETRAAMYLWTTEIDPTWLRCQVDYETGELKGVHVSKCEGTIPKVTPFIFNLEPGFAKAEYESVAYGIFAEIGKEIILPNGHQLESDNAVAQRIDAWNSFMDAFNNGPKKDSFVDQTAERFIYLPKDVSISGRYAATGKRNEAILRRSSRFKKGERLSGFDAFEKYAMGKLPKGLKVGAMGEPNIEQAREALKGVARPSSQAVAWYATNDPEKARLRLQAAQSMPLLAAVIAERKSLADTVDKMEPLTPKLMKLTGLNKAGIKRVGKLDKPAPAGRLFEEGQAIEGADALGINRARHTRISGSVQTDRALNYLSMLPPDRAPQDNEGWLRYNDILAALAIPLENATGIPVKKVLDACNGDWVKFHASLAKAADFEIEEFDRRAMALATIDVLEAIEHFTRTALMPQALASIVGTGEAEPGLSQETFREAINVSTTLVLGNSKNPALNIMEISRKYASRVAMMMEVELSAKAKTDLVLPERFQKFGSHGFPGLISVEFRASNGRVIRPLVTAEALVEESRRLNHCIGYYQLRARLTKSHLLSVQNEDGSESFSSFEISGIKRLDGGDHGLEPLSEVQHYKRGNTRPTQDCLDAVQEFYAAIEKGDLALNIEEIMDWRNVLESQGFGSNYDGYHGGIAHEIGGGGGYENLRVAENLNVRVEEYQRVRAPDWSTVLDVNWKAEDMRLNIWNEWRQVLSGKLAKSADPGVIYTEKGARELVSTMSPKAAAIMIEQAAAARDAKKEEQPTP